MSTEIIEQGRMTTVEGIIVELERDTPFSRDFTNPMTGEILGRDTGALRVKMAVETDDGIIIKWLPAAGLKFNFRDRVRVMCEILPAK